MFIDSSYNFDTVEKDRHLMINHFYKSLRFFYVSIPITYFLILLGIKLFELYESNVIIVLVLAISISLSYLFVKVYHFLLSFLAFQRFCLYFFPKSEKVLSIKQSSLNKLVYLAYTLFAIQDIWYIFHHHGEYYLSFPNMHISLAILLMASSLLYVPIYLSVRKLGHLMSAQMNAPQKFIFWQTAVVAIGKLHSLLFLLINILNGAIETQYLYQFMSMLDVTVIPAVLQVTYLGCNKRNLDLLLNSYKSKRFLKTLCCCGGSTQVQPIDGSGDKTTVYAIPVN
ncbi:hypothetical protein CAEBREN_13640 [Caenorhabditis brenneri]|uniref:Serpentine Receptor, class Z n=1 Tax=Caenorhabditis brenneri TaxID=135651 RepID=G0NQ56_CAEBE|nr:hypothetical protein CAEBREN_13640 [Caenorhabditis brenneri]